MMSTDSSTTLLKQLKAAKRLPSPPGTAVRVLELCRRDDAKIQDIADTIMSDPALSGRLLKYANSPIVGAGREITSVRSAVMLLGLRTVKMTALGFSLASPDFQPRCPEFDLSQFWSESFLTAVDARRVADKFFSTDREEAFTAGLLSQIGRLALAHGMPEDYQAVLSMVKGGMLLAEAERRVLGIDHMTFGAQLLADWELPDVLVEAVQNQEYAFQNNTAVGPALPQVIHLAVRLMPLFAGQDKLPSSIRQTARAAIEKKLKLDEQAWQNLAREIQEDYQQVAEMFDMGVSTEVNVFDLYAEAQEEVARVGMAAQLERDQALEENQTLLQRATTDALTGIANRAKFDERLDELVKGLHRDHGHFALVMFDIDHFKKFNDTYGHDVGDLVLKHVAKAVQGILRDVDLVARYGGEEFVVLAPCTDRRGACVVAIRVCQSVERMRVHLKEQELQVTVSAGLALTSDYKHPPDAETLIRDADKQLYVSKEGGRNTWSYFGRTAATLLAR